MAEWCEFVFKYTFKQTMLKNKNVKNKGKTRETSLQMKNCKWMLIKIFIK